MLEVAPKLVDSTTQRVLIVDDDEAVLELTGEFLGRAGRESQSAASGQQAIELFQKGIAEIGVVILDLTMPDIDGREVFEAIRRLRPDIPVVLATGLSPNRLAESFSDESRVCFLQKPYEPEQLLEAIRSASQAQKT